MNWKRNALVWSMVAIASCALANGPKKIVFTVDGYEGTEPIAEFPVLVRLSEATIKNFQYADCSANGADLTFTTREGTELARQVERWNPAGESVVWVKLPELKKGASFECHYGDKATKAHPDSQSDGSVWSGGYAAVWHFSEADGVAYDSSPSDLNAVPQGEDEESIAVEGVVGHGRQNSVSGESENRLLVPSYDYLGIGGTFTASAWFNAQNANSYMRLWSRKDAYNDRGWELELGSDNYRDLYAYGSSGKEVKGTYAASMKGTWFHVTLVYDQATVTIYVNGKLLKSGPIDPVIDNGRPLGIGGNAVGNRANYRGFYDEMRILAYSASPERVRAEYETMAKKDFLSTGNGVE